MLPEIIVNCRVHGCPVVIPLRSDFLNISQDFRLIFVEIYQTTIVKWRKWRYFGSERNNCAKASVVTLSVDKSSLYLLIG